MLITIYLYKVRLSVSVNFESIIDKKNKLQKHIKDERVH